MEFLAVENMQILLQIYISPIGGSIFIIIAHDLPWLFRRANYTTFYSTTHMPNQVLVMFFIIQFFIFIYYLKVILFLNSCVIMVLCL